MNKQESKQRRPDHPRPQPTRGWKRLGRTALAFGLAGACAATICPAQPPGGEDPFPPAIGLKAFVLRPADLERVSTPDELTVVLFGVDPNAPYRVLLDGQEAQIVWKSDGPPQGFTVRVRVKNGPVEAGSYDLGVEQGGWRITRLGGFHVVPRPTLQGTVCGSEQPVTVTADQLEIKAPSLPEKAGWSFRVDGNDVPQSGNAKSHLYQIDLSEMEGSSHELEVRVLHPESGPVEFCRQRIERPAEPRLRVARLSYDPTRQELRFHGEGAALPESLEVIFRPDAGESRRLTLEAIAGTATDREYVAAVAQSRGALVALEVHAGGTTLYSGLGRWVADGSPRWSWRRFASRNEAILADLYEEITAGGRITLAGAAYEWVKIPVRTYHLGLSEQERHNPTLAERNLAAPSSRPGGAVVVRLLRPFLIGVHEVTQAQYHCYVRAAQPPADQIPEALRRYASSELPAELAELPATQVSFVAARRFVAWLQEQLAAHSDRWLVRLPHEIEWEMAARGGETVDHAFRDQDEEQGIASLAHDGPRAVGTNDWDRSLFGVRDMTGNVREWTRTVYQENLLELLTFHLESQSLEGWDPTRPDTRIFQEVPDRELERVSRNVTIRGASNREPEPVFYLLSLRRQQEMSVAADDVGFRLVLVPRDSP